MLLLLGRHIQYLLLVEFTITKSRFLAKSKKREYSPLFFGTKRSLSRSRVSLGYVALRQAFKYHLKYLMTDLPVEV